MGLGRTRYSHRTREDTTFTWNSGEHDLYMELGRTRPLHGTREDSTFTWKSGGHDIHMELGTWEDMGLHTKLGNTGGDALHIGNTGGAGFDARGHQRMLW